MVVDLPDEIWSYIFKHLSSNVLHNTVSLVCKSWLKIIRNDVRHLDLKHHFLDKLFDEKDKTKFIADEPLNSLMSDCLKIWPKVQTIEMDWVWRPKEENSFWKNFYDLTLDDFKKAWNLPFIKWAPC